MSKKSSVEPSKKEILASIKRGMQQALRGEGRPAHEFLDEIDAKSKKISSNPQNINFENLENE